LTGDSKEPRFTKDQIVQILNDADAVVPVNKTWHRHKAISATHHNWKSKYGGLGIPEFARVPEPETENSQLKRLYADLALESRAT